MIRVAVLTAVMVALCVNVVYGWSNSEAVLRAASHADLSWVCSQQNTEADCTEDDYDCQFTAGNTYTGAPYKWDWTFRSLATIITDLGNGLGAGIPAGDPILACATGNDCSGFISTCWDLSVKHNTNDLLNVSMAWQTPLDKDAPGQIYLNPGSHVVMIGSEVISDYPIYHAANSESRVVYQLKDAIWLSDYELRINTSYQNPVSPVYNALVDPSGVCTWEADEDAAGNVRIAVRGVGNEILYLSPPIDIHQEVWAGASGDERPYLISMDTGDCLAQFSAASSERSNLVYEPANEMGNGSVEKARSAQVLVVIAPLAWSEEVEELETFWESLGHNVLVEYLPVGWDYWSGGSIQSAVSEIQYIIGDAWFTFSATAAVLIGDFSPWRDNGGVQPAHDIIPSWEVGEFIPDEYGYSDLPYSDLNGDGVYDIPVSRVPAASAADVAAWTAKLQLYYGMTTPSVSGGRGLVVCSDEHIRMLEQIYTQNIAHNVLEIASNGSDCRLTIGSQVLEQGWSSHAQAVTDVHGQFTPDFHVVVAANSNRADIGHVLGGASIGVTGLGLYATCQGGNFDSPTSNAEALLMGQDGPIAVLGPVGSSLQPGNKMFAEQFIEALLSASGSFLGQEFIDTVNQIVATVPVGGEISNTVKRYTLLGDPVVGYRTNGAVTSVNNQYDRRTVDMIVTPNPVSSNAAFVISPPNKRRGSMLEIYDIRGRLVWKNSESLVQYEWDGCDMYGKRVASGTYNVRYHAGGVNVVNKMIVIK